MSKLELINHKSYPRNRSESIRLKNPTRIELYTQDSSSREQAINSETELHEQARAERRGKLRTFTPTESPVHGLVLPKEPEAPGPRGRRRRLLRDTVPRRGRRRTPPPRVQPWTSEKPDLSSGRQDRWERREQRSFPLVCCGLGVLAFSLVSSPPLLPC